MPARRIPAITGIHRDIRIVEEPQEPGWSSLAPDSAGTGAGGTDGDPPVSELWAGRRESGEVQPD